jgi:hypothetical protein
MSYTKHCHSRAESFENSHSKSEDHTNHLVLLNFRFVVLQTYGLDYLYKRLGKQFVAQFVV